MITHLHLVLRLKMRGVKPALCLYTLIAWRGATLPFCQRSKHIYHYFIFFWPCILLQFFANDQLDALFYIFTYYTSLHVLNITVLIIRRSNCINTSSGMISLCERLLGMPVRNSLLTGIPSSHSHRLIIPDDVLIQFDLLMMSTVMFETCREV